MTVISNSSPLIYLSKAGRLHLLRDTFGEVMIPGLVYREVVEKGIAGGHQDALMVRKGIEDGWIRVVEVMDEPSLDSLGDIHGGEAEAIHLARERRLSLIIDDSTGAVVAESRGVKVRGTVFVVLEGLRRGHLSRKEAKETVYSVIRAGFRLDPEVLYRVIKEIDEIGEIS